MRYAVDLGGTHVRVATAENGCDFRHEHRSRRPAGMTPGDFVTLLSGLADAWGTGMPRSIGVSAAAVVGEGGLLLAAENLGWKDVPLGRLLKDAFACPVTVETDVVCGATFEATAGAAKGAGSALYLGIGTGIGHAFILNGRVWRGSRRGANAFGHLVVEPDGEACYCGHRGCLCTVASGRAQAGKPADARPLEMLALAVGNAVTLIEPECIILSGGALNQPWFDLVALADLVSSFSYPAARKPRFVRSKAAEPNLCGALILSLETS
ncbi:ROK family protein [Ensifer soli]|uniref:ROK family protein n=1 Tax=Ciceribacter sp. sgz301302 TaxID=3342379 RepID=UPI0035BA8430